MTTDGRPELWRPGMPQRELLALYRHEIDLVAHNLTPAELAHADQLLQKLEDQITYWEQFWAEVRRLTPPDDEDYR